MGSVDHLIVTDVDADVDDVATRREEDEIARDGVGHLRSLLELHGGSSGS